MRKTQELTRTSLILTIVFILSMYSPIILRFSIEVAVLIFVSNYISIRYAYLVGVLIPLYNIMTGYFPDILIHYIPFVIISNILFIAILKDNDTIEGIIKASMGKIFINYILLYINTDMTITLYLLLLNITVMVSCLIGFVLYNCSKEILHKRNLLRI